MMIFTQALSDLLQYIGEGFARIFSPSDDEYPMIGIQPFDGEIHSPTNYFNW